jgi:hypothetical protein
MQPDPVAESNRVIKSDLVVKSIVHTQSNWVILAICDEFAVPDAESIAVCDAYSDGISDELAERVPNSEPNAVTVADALQYCDAYPKPDSDAERLSEPNAVTVTDALQYCDAYPKPDSDAERLSEPDTFSNDHSESITNAQLDAYVFTVRDRIADRDADVNVVTKRDADTQPVAVGNADNDTQSNSERQSDAE